MRGRGPLPLSPARTLFLLAPRVRARHQVANDAPEQGRLVRALQLQLHAGRGAEGGARCVQGQARTRSGGGGAAATAATLHLRRGRQGEDGHLLAMRDDAQQAIPGVDLWREREREGEA